MHLSSFLDLIEISLKTTKLNNVTIIELTFNKNFFFIIIQVYTMTVLKYVLRKI